VLTEHSTLAQFLIEERRRHPGSNGELNSLILDVALACKAISMRIASGTLTGVFGNAGGVNPHGVHKQKVDAVANDIFLRAHEWGGLVAGMASGELDQPYVIPAQYARGKYLLTFDPLEGSANIDVNQTVGSIFSILRAPVAGDDARPDDFLQRGTAQVAAGYAIYGPSTVLVLTVGSGVHAFTLDPRLGEFFLTRQDMRLPEATAECAVDSSNRRFWEPSVLRYIEECLQGVTGPRQKDFDMRWVASLVAETHRILTCGGVFLDPRDTEDPAKSSGLRLLYEANPIAFLIEQAGGLAATGRERVLEIRPTELHQRISFIFGCRDEVERLVRYHAEVADRHSSDIRDYPLYGPRGLFRLTN
jgi:fructose-1,6-bisphosphatase I/sedoheptulose-1,7-bisphosphatase